jgi:anti-anti-sigma factor
MELKVSRESGYVLGATVGAIDDSAQELFREHLHPLVAERGTRLVLDLSQSAFLNSSGIGQLVSLAAHANSCGSRLILAACTPFVGQVLDRCKLNRFFEMAASVSEAAGRLTHDNL